MSDLNNDLNKVIAFADAAKRAGEILNICALELSVTFSDAFVKRDRIEAIEKASKQNPPMGGVPA